MFRVRDPDQTKRVNAKFERACALMGWDVTPSRWQGDTLVVNVGQTFIQRVWSDSNIWRIVQITNAGGAERNLVEGYSPKELEAFLDGILALGDVIQKHNDNGERFSAYIVARHT